jgi:nicotinamidase-related amidase
MESEDFKLLVDVLKHPAMVTVDLHRGHLDPSVATLPVPKETAEIVLENSLEVLNETNKLGIPAVHVITSYRSSHEIINNPFWNFQNNKKRSSRKGIESHNLIGSPGTELMPGIYHRGDYVVNCKKRYDCFYETDLHITLKSLGVRSIFFMGVNTNSCVLATAIGANVRDYAVFVVKECVASMDGNEAHKVGLQALSFAFGWAVTKEELINNLLLIK